jgi:hypothetical protein
VYNKFEDDGLQIDEKRRVDVFAVDFNSTLPHINTFITGEWAWIKVNVPPDYTQQFGRKQQGGFVDIVQPILKRRMLGWDRATLNLACRLDYVDWNVATFNDTGGNISDDVWGITPAISFRPSAQTVFRFNYKFQRQTDLLGNPPSTLAGFQFGFSTYF